MRKLSQAAITSITSAVRAQLAGNWPQQLNWSGGGSDALGAWFLGPKAENRELLLRLVNKALSAHADSRCIYFPDDPAWLTEERKQSASYAQAVQTLESELDTMLQMLDASVPFYSYRYQGHMLWDVTLPSVLGYVAALLYNQNNVAAEASPVTTWLEMLVGDDLCRMLGYYTPDRDPATGNYQPADPGKTIAWGHITCGGSVANSEALWAARNAKFLPIGVAAALRSEEALKPARTLQVRLVTGEEKPLVQLSSWELMNLSADVAVTLADRVKREYTFAPGVDVDGVLATYSLQHVGLIGFMRELAPAVECPAILAPATAHYSWPKGASLVGLGRSSVRMLPVDLDARLDLAALRAALDRCLAERTPVVMVVAVLGTTEHSAIDPIAPMLALREEYREQGLEFWLHVDAAWGGYFASMLRVPRDNNAVSLSQGADSPIGDPNVQLFGPDIVMSDYVNTQYVALGETDSITIDPHKAGYVPYPAGGLCYRNGAMRHLVAFTAPVVYHGQVDATVGVYGIEGSKPGAAPSAVYLSHRVIRTDQSGYGRILGRCLWNSKRLYCALLTMAEPDDPFTVVALQRLPCERQEQPDPEQLAAELRRMREQVVPKTNEELIHMLNSDPAQLAWFRELGSDQIILSYAFNFKTRAGLNRDLALTNKLNDKIFRQLSLAARHDDLPPSIPLFVTTSELTPSAHGSLIVNSFKQRLGVESATTSPVNFLISTTMDPWLSDTAVGNYIPVLIATLRSVVSKIIESSPEFH